MQDSFWKAGVTQTHTCTHREKEREEELFIVYGKVVYSSASLAYDMRLTDYTYVQMAKACFSIDDLEDCTNWCLIYLTCSF